MSSIPGKNSPRPKGIPAKMPRGPRASSMRGDKMIRTTKNGRIANLRDARLQAAIQRVASGAAYRHVRSQ